MSAGITHDTLSVSVYAKNLLNWKNIIQYPSVNSVQVQEGYTVRPMTIGILATWHRSAPTRFRAKGEVGHISCA